MYFRVKIVEAGCKNKFSPAPECPEPKKRVPDTVNYAVFNIFVKNPGLMWKRICIFLTCVMLAMPAVETVAQDTDSGRRIDEAIRLMDDGLYAESEDLLKSVLAAEPDNYLASYELAYLNYLREDYKAAVRILEKLKKSPGNRDLTYQILGNAYDLMGNRKRAEAAYKQGLAEFPRSGRLYLELGNVAYNNGEYLPALAYFEQGIAAEPSFPSNYYNVSNVFFRSSEVVWGMFYGEIFMNMERGSKRTRTMSRYLYNAYKQGITVGRDEDSGDRTLTIDFSRRNEISVTPDSLVCIPFGTGVYETVLGMSFPTDADSVDMASLNRMRCNFVGNYFSAMDELRGKVTVIPDTPNILLNYQRRITEAGHMEAYNYWILMEGDPDSTGAWAEAHGDEWEAFMNWFRENPMTVDGTHYFHRNLYEDVSFEE